ncbi:cytochrome P450 [Favolaschia claudopus]|uniref:Cytochrome P450 n=1 Tax=Favolaschia claudopus TaxID=2862362 RepID=A0AAV9Z1A0_9AGAR
MSSLELQPVFQYGIIALIVYALLRNALSNRQHDPSIPTLGSTNFLASYLDALRFLLRAPDLVQQGYNLNPQGIFRQARLYRWEYVVCGSQFVKEVGNAAENELSFHEGLEDVLQSRITMGRGITENPYHIITIKNNLTRNLHARFPDVRDEIVSAFDDVLHLQGDEWKAITALPAVMDIVARASNRLFVGLPLCRDKTYLDNNVRHTIDIIKSAAIISLFPEPWRPYVGPWISSRERSNVRASKFLRPLLEERLAKECELGRNWEGKPNDFISWLLETAQDEDRTVEYLSLRILATNMGALHTSSMAFTHACFDLTTHPEHFFPMREEAERVVQAEGWTKFALDSMVLIDSFFRESQRLNPAGPLIMQRRVVSPTGFCFSDGTVLPQGAFLSVASKAAHYNPGNHEDLTTFDGFRFARERAEHRKKSKTAFVAEDSSNIDSVFKRHMVSVAPDHLPFGTGKHACPGRFFAAIELKAMMAHLVINYDIKADAFDAGGVPIRPADLVFGPYVSPNPKAKMWVRKRQLQNA